MSIGMGYSMFSVMPVIFMVMFALVFGVIVFSVVKGISEWNKNNASPLLKVDAKIVAKRMSVSNSTSDTGNGVHSHSSSTDYYVTFQVESGSRMEFHVPDREYGMLVEGDEGKLSFQGTRYKGFERSL